MSIIHDALKKVQQGLTPPAEETKTDTSTTAPEASGYIYTAPDTVETLPPVKNKIQSVSVQVCTVLITTAITIASIEYIYQQFQINMPTVKKFAQKSFFSLVHKKTLPQTPEKLKPLAQFATLNVRGIMANGPNNLALINDQVYQEGDVVNGIKIVKISLDSITVINNGTEQTIPVKN